LDIMEEAEELLACHQYWDTGGGRRAAGLTSTLGHKGGRRATSLPSTMGSREEAADLLPSPLHWDTGEEAGGLGVCLNTGIQGSSQESCCLTLNTGIQGRRGDYWKTGPRDWNIIELSSWWLKVSLFLASQGGRVA
jgi:hypothetical protein